MAKAASAVVPGEVASAAAAVTRYWRGGRERQLMGLTGRRLRRRRRGGTVRLGNRRRGLMLRRLVRWWSSQLRWRLATELLGPVKKAVMEIVSGRQLVQSQHLALPFICNFPVPLV